MDLKFRPIQKEDIEVRPTDTKYKGKCTLLLYMDSRAAVRILNETVGPMNWQMEFHGECTDMIFCRLSIWDEDKNRWIVREDVGSPSNIESYKGEASDSLKRCLARFGCDYLYTAPTIKIKCPDNYYYNDKLCMSFSVKHIEYQNGKISKLIICDRYGNIVFDWANGEEKITDNLSVLKSFCRSKQDGGENKDEVLKFYKYYESKIESFKSFDPDRLWSKWTS